MNATEIREGDDLALRLIADYWYAFTGSDSTWNFYNFPPHYVPRDQWATREQWVTAAKQCIVNNTKILFGLEVLLAEGYTSYTRMAEKIVLEWRDKYGGGDPYYYYDILKYLPHDNPVRCEYLPDDDPAGLDREPLSALVSVENEAACRYVANQITKAYALDSDDSVREDALPWLKMLGRLCTKYVEPAIMESAKQFCLEYLDKDREIAPYRDQIWAETGDDEDNRPRTLWICDEIAYLAWRVGWFDILTQLRYQPWYWDALFAYWWSDGNNVDLMVWSQYVVSDMLRSRALHVMRTHQYSRTDGAIAWLRMSHATWPPSE